MPNLIKMIHVKTGKDTDSESLILKPVQDTKRMSYPCLPGLFSREGSATGPATLTCSKEFRIPVPCSGIQCGAPSKHKWVRDTGSQT